MASKPELLNNQAADEIGQDFLLAYQRAVLLALQRQGFLNEMQCRNCVQKLEEQIKKYRKIKICKGIVPFSIRTVAKACDSPYDTCKGGGFMLQVAAYCRVSTDKEDQANSFEAQQRYFREYIQRQPDWELQGIYADEGFSGTSTNKRVEFNKMLHAAELGQIDLIVTKEVSRFTRNTVDALQITRELRRRGVGVLFLNDSLDTRTNDGELRLTIMSSVRTGREPKDL